MFLNGVAPTGMLCLWGFLPALRSRAAALELCDEPGIRVSGGTTQQEGYNLSSPVAEQSLPGLTVDIAFLRASAVDVE